jgi:hypothetical protein
MRTAFLQSMGMHRAFEHPDTRWVVAWTGDEAMGTLGYLQLGHEMWVTDLYRVNGPGGLSAFMHLFGWAERHAEKHEYELIFAVPAENEVLHRAVEKDHRRQMRRGTIGYTVEAIVYRKRRKS